MILSYWCGCTAGVTVLLQILEPRTLLRDSQDPSFLLNLLIDAAVDHSFPVVEAYSRLLQVGLCCRGTEYIWLSNVMQRDGRDGWDWWVGGTGGT